jgi:galactokinase
MIMDKNNRSVIIAAEPGRVYPEMRVNDIEERIRPAFEGYAQIFGGKPPRLFSAPGRVELSGNHTDHQGGRVLAAAIALDDLIAAAPNGDNVIRICSDTHPPAVVNLDDLSPRDDDRGKSSALVRGIAEYFMKHGRKTAGFNAFVSGMVPVGSGLSSSAAFETSVAEAINGLFYGGEMTPAEIALAGQYAENHHYGKPCGLMDQLASAVGGIVEIDFLYSNPEIKRLSLSFENFGYSLAVIDSGSKHENLSDEYAAIPEEMRDTAKLLGAARLRDIDPDVFYKNLPSIRGNVSDRALMRSMHFFSENERVAQISDALKRGDFGCFLDLIRDSGHSSWMLLQNIYPAGAVLEQASALALVCCERLLSQSGACRVHGGGFGGTILAFVPSGARDEFSRAMEELTGPGSCRFYPIREAGAVELLI